MAAVASALNVDLATCAKASDLEPALCAARALNGLCGRAPHASVAPAAEPLARPLAELLLLPEVAEDGSLLVLQALAALLRTSPPAAAGQRSETREVADIQVYFISHRWLREQHPDDERNSKLRVLASMVTPNWTRLSISPREKATLTWEWCARCWRRAPA